MVTEDLAHVALTPCVVTHQPRVVLRASAHPHALLGHQDSTLRPQDRRGPRIRSACPECGHTHSSGGLRGSGWRMTPSPPVSFLIQVRSGLQDFVFGGTGCARASWGQNSLVLPQCPGKTRPSPRLPDSGLERRHLFAPLRESNTCPRFVPARRQRHLLQRACNGRQCLGKESKGLDKGK